VFNRKTSRFHSEHGFRGLCAEQGSGGADRGQFSDREASGRFPILEITAEKRVILNSNIHRS